MEITFESRKLKPITTKEIKNIIVCTYDFFSLVLNIGWHKNNDFTAFITDKKGNIIFSYADTMYSEEKELEKFLKKIYKQI